MLHIENVDAVQYATHRSAKYATHYIAKFVKLKKIGTNNIMRKDKHSEYSSFLKNVVEDSSVVGCYIVLIGK